MASSHENSEAREGRARALTYTEQPEGITSIEFVFTVRHAKGLKNLDAASLRNFVSRKKADKSDPYCKVFVGSDYLGSTDVVWDNLDPVWESTFRHTCKAVSGCLDYRSPQFRYSPGLLATFILFDKDLLTQDDHLGWVRMRGRAVVLSVHLARPTAQIHPQRRSTHSADPPTALTPNHSAASSAAWCTGPWAARGSRP